MKDLVFLQRLLFDTCTAIVKITKSLLANYNYITELANCVKCEPVLKR